MNIFKLAGCCLLASSFAGAAAEPAAMRYFKTVERQKIGQESLLAAPLDSQIYAATQDGFPDLRLFDETGAETPYLLEKSVEPHSEIVHVQHPGDVIALHKKGGNGIEVLLRADKDTPPTDGFTLRTPLSNDEHRVQVFGSNDGKNWALLVRDASIYDYSRYMDISNRDIALPANTYREFKLVVEEATQTQQAELMELTRKMHGGQEQERSERSQIKSVPLRIDHIEFWHNVKKDLPADDKKFDYPIVEFKTQEDAKNHWTVIEVKTQRQPLTRLSLQSASRNFSRAASVQVPVRYGMETQWRDIGNATLQALHLYDIKREQTAIDFAEQRQENYRIIIRNQDNPPLAINGIQAQGNGYRLVFLAAPDKTYTVHYSAESAEKPRYDITPIREPLQAGYPAELAQPGPEQAAPTAAVSAFDISKLLNSRLFLGVAIALMVAVLAWALIGAGRQIAQLPKD